MKVLITGAGGFLGRRMTPVLARDNTLRLADIRLFESTHEVMVGDVTSLDDARRMVAGMDALVLGHMASRGRMASGEDKVYATPPLPFDINVKGTANLFHAAVEAGVKRVVLISSLAAVNGNPKGGFQSRDLPLRGNDMYSLTKALQEQIAEHYHRMHGVAVAMLRPGWIVDADSCLTKYDTPYCFASNLIDCRDIGKAARLCCALPDLAYEVFYVAGPECAAKEMDIAYTTQRLGWRPEFRFENLAAQA